MRIAYFCAIAWCISMSALLTIICIAAIFTGGKVILDFNAYSENIFEAVLFSVLTGLAFIGILKLSK